MAIDTVAYTISALSHSAELFRRASGALLLGTSGGSATGSGVKLATDFAVSAGGGMTVNVAAGEAEVFGTLSTAQGPYYCRNGASVNLAIAASDPTNPRIDVVCITVQDSQYAGAFDRVLLQVITGTPAGTPAAPALPANSCALANVLVPASSSSVTAGNITSTRAMYRAGEASHALSADGVTAQFSGGVALAGASPPAGTKLTRQSFAGTYSSDSAANVHIAFPVTYPNGVIYCMPHLYFLSGLYPTWQIDPWAFSLSNCVAALNNVQGPALLPSQAGVRIQTEVVGW